MRKHCDFLVVGSGVAGLLLGLKLSSLGSVCVVTKKRADDCATSLAQGGIACVVSEEDSFEDHIRDTLRAGDGLCHEEVVELVVRSAPERIRELMELGVEFTRDPKDPRRFHLGLEGGHSKRRILHVEDHTGRALEDALLKRIREREGVELLEGHLAVDLIVKEGRVAGAYVMEWGSSEVVEFVSPVVILATGGAGKVYLYTSNPDTATGDGVAMALRAGARVANLEFVQFHPTCLYHPKAKNFLISEALRGEGAILLDPSFRPFMHKYDPERKDLAPRDIVARAMDEELKKSGADHLWLDISHRDSAFIKERFPYIYRTCLKFGIDITREPIPVVPAAHYMCGGIVVDSWGKTDLYGLFAVGECAFTGLHGANRLASNSLLEALVFAHRAYLKIKEELSELKATLPKDIPPWQHPGSLGIEEKVFVSHNWDLVRRLMWNYVGIVRSLKRLELAERTLEFVSRQVEEYYASHAPNAELVELRNLLLVAKLIVRCASLRLESRGTHFLKDYPYRREEFRRDTVVSREVLNR